MAGPLRESCPTSDKAVRVRRNRHARQSRVQHAGFAAFREYLEALRRGDHNALNRWWQNQDPSRKPESPQE